MGLTNAPVLSKRRECTVLLVSTAVVITAGFFLRMLFFNGLVGSDDLSYFKFSEQLLNSLSISASDLAASRLTFLVLVGFPGALGGNLFFSALVNVVYATLLDIIVTAFAYLRIGPRAGLIVAVFLAFGGVPMTYSGTFLPDTLLALFMVTAAILIFISLEKDSPSLGLLIVAGTLTGFAYSTKDPGVLLIPPVLLSLAFARSDLPLSLRFKMIGNYIAGFLVIWFAESLAYAFLAGDFFYKINAVANVHNAAMGRSTSVYDFVKHSWWNFHLFFRQWDYLLVPLLLALPAWIVIVLRHRRYWLFAFAGIFITIYLVAGTSSLTRLVNLPFQERYILPVLPFAAISLGFISVHYIRGNALYRTVVVALAVVLFSVGTMGAIPRAGALYFTELIRTAALVVQLLPRGKKVFVDSRTYKGLQHVLSSRDVTRVQEFDRSSKPNLAGYYLLFQRRNGKKASDFEYMIKENNFTIVNELQIDQRLMRRYYPIKEQIEFVLQIYEKN